MLVSRIYLFKSPFEDDLVKAFEFSNHDTSSNHDESP